VTPLLEVLAAASILAIIAGGAYIKGAKDARLEADAQRLQAVERAIQQANEQARIDAEILTAAAERSAAIQTKTRTIIKRVQAHVQPKTAADSGGHVDSRYRSCTLDPVGLCLAREAAAGRDGAACPGRADAALPAAGITGGRDDGRDAGELRGNGDAPARMPGYALGAERVDAQ